MSKIHRINLLKVDDILAMHKARNIKHRYKHVNELSYLYWIGKFHKDLVKARFIAGVPASKTKKTVKQQRNTVKEIFEREQHSSFNSTTAASKYLSKQLQLIMSVLLQKDQENFQRTGIRRCWFIKSTEEVFLEIKKNQEYLNLRQPRTFDFTTMYTNLKHERIISNLENTIKEARDYINKMPTKKQEELNMVLKSDLNI